MTRKTPASSRVQFALWLPWGARLSFLRLFLFIQVFLSDRMDFCGATWTSSPALGICADGGLRGGERAVSAY